MTPELKKEMITPEWSILCKNNINDYHIVNLDSKVSVRCALASMREHASIHHSSKLSEAAKELPSMRMYEKVKATFPDQVYVWFHYEASAIIARLSGDIERIKMLMREVVMRNHNGMPEQDQDFEWFEQGTDITNSGDYMERIFAELELGKPLTNNQKYEDTDTIH